jgi:hypothetical protein
MQNEIIEINNLKFQKKVKYESAPFVRDISPEIKSIEQQFETIVNYTIPIFLNDLHVIRPKKINSYCNIDEAKLVLTKTSNLSFKQRLEVISWFQDNYEQII